MDYLEPEYAEAYEGWKNNSTPEGNSSILNTIDPIVRKGTSMFGVRAP